MSVISAFSPLERTRWFADHEGMESTSKREDEILGWSHDWTDELASGETISSAAYVDSGTTRTGVTLSGAITSCNVTGIGEFEVTLTLSTGRSLQRVIRFYATQGTKAADYR